MNEKRARREFFYFGCVLLCLSFLVSFLSPKSLPLSFPPFPEILHVDASEKNWKSEYVLLLWYFFPSHIS